MRIEAQGTVYDAINQPASRRIAFFTSLCALRTGQLLCAYQVGTGKHAPDSTVGVCSSIDNGETWTPSAFEFATVLDEVPGSLSAPALVEVEPGRLVLFATWFDRSEPDRPLFDPETEGILRSRLLLSNSADSGQSWSPWSTLAVGELTGCCGTGPALQWSDGTIAFAFESFKEFDDPRPARHGAWLLVSRDGCRTFGPPVLVAQDPANVVYYWDQRLCATSQSGEFYGLFWTHDRSRQMDLNVHFQQGQLDLNNPDTIVLKTAPDANHAPSATSIPGQIAAPLWIDSQRLLAFVVDRNRPGTLKLWVSRDGGESWPEDDCLTVHTHDEQAVLAQKSARVDFADYWEDMGKWSFGHPAILPLDDQKVLLGYYAGTPDQMSIHWCRASLNPDQTE